MGRPKKTENDHIIDELQDLIAGITDWAKSCRYIITLTTDKNSVEAKYVGDQFHALVDIKKRLQILVKYLATKDEVSYYMTPNGDLRSATPEQKLHVLIRQMDNFKRDVRYSDDECLHSEEN